MSKVFGPSPPRAVRHAGHHEQADASLPLRRAADRVRGTPVVVVDAVAAARPAGRSSRDREAACRRARRTASGSDRSRSSMLRVGLVRQRHVGVEIEASRKSHAGSLKTMYLKRSTASIQPAAGRPARPSRARCRAAAPERSPAWCAGSPAARRSSAPHPLARRSGTSARRRPCTRAPADRSGSARVRR